MSAPHRRSTAPPLTLSSQCIAALWKTFQPSIRLPKVPVLPVPCATPIARLLMPLTRAQLSRGACPWEPFLQHGDPPSTCHRASEHVKQKALREPFVAKLPQAAVSNPKPFLRIWCQKPLLATCAVKRMIIGLALPLSGLASLTF